MTTKNLILLGPQGSGKSTQAKLLVQRYGMIHVEVGSALRRVAQGDSELAKTVHEIMNIRKELVPNEIAMQVLHQIIGGVDADQGLILDGTPRKETQIRKTEDVLAEYGRKVDKVIFIDLPEEVSVERIASRFACAQCGKTYVIGENERKNHDPKCSECGGDLEQRVDDTPEGVRKRLAVFAAETLPVIEHYRAQGKLLQVDGTKSAEEIFQDIINGLEV